MSFPLIASPLAQSSPVGVMFDPSVARLLTFLSTVASGTDVGILKLFVGWNFNGSRDSCRFRFVFARLWDRSFRTRVVAARLGTFPGLLDGILASRDCWWHFKGRLGGVSNGEGRFRGEIAGPSSRTLEISRVLARRFLGEESSLPSSRHSGVESSNNQLAISSTVCGPGIALFCGVRFAISLRLRLIAIEWLEKTVATAELVLEVRT